MTTGPRWAMCVSKVTFRLGNLRHLPVKQGMIDSNSAQGHTWYSQAGRGRAKEKRLLPSGLGPDICTYTAPNAAGPGGQGLSVLRTDGKAAPGRPTSYRQYIGCAAREHGGQHFPGSPHLDQSNKNSSPQIANFDLRDEVESPTQNKVFCHWQAPS